MPIYEYECVTCSRVHEVMQKFSDAPLTACPDCHGLVEKIMSRTSFALKGSGWYTTDYKKTPAKVPAATDPAAAPAEAASATAPASPAVTAAPAPTAPAASAKI